MLLNARRAVGCLRYLETQTGDFLLGFPTVENWGVVGNLRVSPDGHGRVVGEWFVRRECLRHPGVLGRGGLDVHDTTPKYALKSMPGEFTGLHLVSLMFVGFRQIDPSLNGGIDLSPEYAEAKKLFMLM